MENIVTVNVQLQLNHKGEPFTSEASMLAWITGCLNCNINNVEATVTFGTKPTVIVGMDGGLIQEMNASQPVRIIVLDADIEGTTDDVIEIDGEEVIVIDRDEVQIDADYVQTVVDQVDSAEG